MANFPEFMLRALYVKGSLINNEDGFEFQIRNDLGPVRVVGAGPLLLDRKPLPLDSCSFALGDTAAGFADVSIENSVLMHKGEALVVKVDGTSLRPGRRALGINVTVKDIGQIRFTVSDTVSA
jgi:hypothetical protein